MPLHHEAGAVVDHSDRRSRRQSGDRGAQGLGRCQRRFHQRAATCEAAQHIDRDRARRIELEPDDGAGRGLAERRHATQRARRRLAADLRLDARTLEQLGQFAPAVLVSDPGRGRQRLRGHCDRRRARGRRAVVIVEALLGLAAEQSAGHARRQQRRGLIHRLAEILTVNAHHHRMGDISADQIQQLEGPHAEAGGLLHQQIDLARAGDALLDDAQRLRPIGAAGVIDHEARRVGCNNRVLADAADKACQRLNQIAGRHAARRSPRPAASAAAD